MGRRHNQKLGNEVVVLDVEYAPRKSALELVRFHVGKKSMTHAHFSSLPHALGVPNTIGEIKREPGDFRVDEVLGFELTGEGEHCFLLIEKTGANTEFVARRLAQFAGLGKMAVSFAGLKDRQGCTRQWFSLHIPGKTTPDWSLLDIPGVEVLSITRHNRKLKRGALRDNAFELLLREIVGAREEVEERLERIRCLGVPNYFGPQRFGHDDGNLLQAHALFRGESSPGRHLRGIYLSAARSWIFNQVLAKRVGESTWDQALFGDVFMFSHSHSFFKADPGAEIDARLNTLEIHPSAPLWGRGELDSTGEVAKLESAIAEEHLLFRQGLERAGLEMGRRPLRVPVSELQWDWLKEDVLRLRFQLPAGSYATSVLREILTVRGEAD
jgi:tRNA pseudouridine13 synthase